MSTFGQVRALIVDPDRYSQQLLRTLLRSMHVEKVHQVKTPEDGLEIMRQMPVHVVFYDEIAGNIGLFLHRLRRDLRVVNITIPVLYICRDARLAALRRVQSHGASAIIVKPVSLTTIESKLQSVLLAPRAFVTTKSYIGCDRRALKRDMPTYVTERRTSPEGESFVASLSDPRGP
jgi:DNA-binding NarL/FixJ family response regulator